MNDAIRLALLATAAMTTAACAVDADDARPVEENTSKTSAAVGVLGYVSWGTPGNDGAPLDLGSDADRTCFLQGVTGSLKGSFQQPARVEVLQRDGRWWLETKAGVGTGAMGYATCIPVTKNRKIMKWPGNNIKDGVPSERAVTYGSNVVGTECFLTGIAAMNGFAGSQSRVELTRILWDGKPVWKLGGHLNPLLLWPEDDAIAGGTATAYCVDMAQAVSSFAFQNVGPAIFETIMTTQNTACGVTKLQGKFIEGGWYDGARVSPEEGSWTAIAQQSKRIEGRCYQNFLFNPF